MTKKIEETPVPGPVPGNESTQAAEGPAKATPAKKKRGAPKGNLNAAKHLAHSQKQARELRDTFKRKAEKDALKILKAAGKEKDPLAKLIARQVARLEAVASRIESYLDRRGYFTQKGDLKPSVTQMVSVVDRLLGEARRLLGAIGGEVPAESTLTSLIVDSFKQADCLRAAESDDPNAAKGTARGKGAAQRSAIAEAAEEADREAAHHEREDLNALDLNAVGADSNHDTESKKPAKRKRKKKPDALDKWIQKQKRKQRSTHKTRDKGDVTPLPWVEWNRGN